MTNVNQEPQQHKQISRRTLLKAIGASVPWAVLAGCAGPRLPNKPQSSTTAPKNGDILKGTDGNSYMYQDGALLPIQGAPSNNVKKDGAERLIAQQRDIITSLQELGIKVDENLPKAVPRSYAEASDAVSADKNKPVGADHFVPILENDGKGGQIWRGWWMAEPPFPFKNDVKFDSSKGYHVDKNGNAMFDPTQIFETDWEKLPQDVRDNFASRLINLKVNKKGIALMARRGGITRGDLPKNAHNFTGTYGSQVDAIEQLTIIPVPENICLENIEKSAITKAYRMAAMEFRDNKEAREGKIIVKWFDPEKGWKIIRGKTIARLAVEGHDLTMLDRLIAGEPISSEDMAEKVGGKPEHWLWNPPSREWFYEAFPTLAGTKYQAGVGHIRNGKLLVGIKHADSRTTEVFDFNAGVVNMASSMKAPGNFPAVLFARAGMAVNDSRFNNHSWYTFRNGNVNLGKPGIEQATWMPLSPDLCPTGDEDQQLMARARTLAQEQGDRNVIAAYWDGSQYVGVNK